MIQLATNWLLYLASVYLYHLIVLTALLIDEICNLNLSACPSLLDESYIIAFRVCSIENIVVVHLKKKIKSLEFHAQKIACGTLCRYQRPF